MDKPNILLELPSRAASSVKAVGIFLQLSQGLRWLILAPLNRKIQANYK